MNGRRRREARSTVHCASRQTPSPTTSHSRAGWKESIVPAGSDAADARSPMPAAQLSDGQASEIRPKLAAGQDNTWKFGERTGMDTRTRRTGGVSGSCVVG